MVGWHHHLNGHEFEQTLGDTEDKETWLVAVHGVAKSRTQMKTVSISISTYLSIYLSIYIYIFSERELVTEQLYPSDEKLWTSHLTFLTHSVFSSEKIRFVQIKFKDIGEGTKKIVCLW